MMPIVFGTLGGLAGLLQASLLARSAKGTPGPLSLLLRLGIVAAVLVYAAVSGSLLLAAGGWLVGYLAAALASYWRLR